MPYSDHPVFDPPNDSQLVWRYMDFPKLMWIIQKEKLHFHRADDFSDPFEGTTPKALKQLRDKSLREAQSEIDSEEVDLLKQWSKGVKNFRKSMFLNCWHANDTESAAMWDLYGNEDKSIAIVSTIERMKDAFKETEETVYIGDLFYVDFYSDLHDIDRESEAKIARVINRTENPNAFQQILFKRQEFSHEHEVRAVISDMSNMGDEEENSKLYFNISIDINKLIEGIYIAPDTPSWFSQVVGNAVNESDLDLTANDVHPSRLDEDPWY
ncbi:DUF2971 domain-containing protein [Haloterrigena sp. H1]|uniref:DUF2971 domain-containing protein n=1 Tax=Haloterrigena sp. H1 TaxID=2552943 RepID=UPI00110E5D7E|nr:DUF2971 domain-containing protein [Haloterrigena sp. H1]TMT85392.1 DUF2971 domain-containing protein [Haloterrigena sp. H1]